MLLLNCALKLVKEIILLSFYIYLINVFVNTATGNLIIIIIIIIIIIRQTRLDSIPFSSKCKSRAVYSDSVPKGKKNM